MDYVTKELFIRNKYKPDVKCPWVEKLKNLLWVFSYLFFCVVIEAFCLCMDQGNRETGKEGRAPNGKEGLNNKKNILACSHLHLVESVKKNHRFMPGALQVSKKSINSFNKYLLSIHYLSDSLLGSRDTKMYKTHRGECRVRVKPASKFYITNRSLTVVYITTKT